MSKRKTIIPVKLTKGNLGKYGYRDILTLSSTKRRDALAKAVDVEGYLPVLRRLVVIRTFNKNREHLFKLYDGDIKWLQKHRNTLEHGYVVISKKSTKKRTQRRRSNIKSVSIKRRKTSSLVIKMSGKRRSTKRRTNKRGGGMSDADIKKKAQKRFDELLAESKVEKFFDDFPEEDFIITRVLHTKRRPDPFKMSNTDKDQAKYEAELLYLIKKDQWEKNMPKGKNYPFDINDPNHNLLRDIRAFVKSMR